MAGYPLLLDLTARRVLVVGGGAVAARRIPSLVDAGADVIVVAPVVRDEIAALPVRAALRPYDTGDV